MASYKLSQVAKEDLIRIHHYGIEKFGQVQADFYFNTFFGYFEIIAKQAFSFESIEFMRKGYRRRICGSESIYFRITDNCVEIMAIIGRQDIDDRL